MNIKKLSLVAMMLLAIKMQAQTEVSIVNLPKEISHCKTVSFSGNSAVDVSSLFSNYFQKVNSSADLEITFSYELKQEEKKIAEKTNKWVSIPVKNTSTGYFETKQEYQEVPEQWQYTTYIEITISYRTKPENISKSETIRRFVNSETGKYGSKRAQKITKKEIEAAVFSALQAECKIVPRVLGIKINSPQILDVNHVAGVKKLLESGQQVDSQVGTNKRTLLIAAIMRNDLQGTQYLLSKQANTNLADNLGWTPLLYAKLYASADIINLLVEKDAKMPETDNQGRQFDEIEKTLQTEIFQNAILNNNHELITNMLQKGFDLNLPLTETYPLESATSLNNSELVKLFLKNGANINLYKKEPALAYALRNRNTEIIDILFNQNPSDLGNVCMDIALERRDYPLVNRLLALEAKGKTIVKSKNIGRLASTRDTMLIKKLYQSSDKKVYIEDIYEFMKYADNDFMDWVFSELEYSSISILNYEKMLNLVQKENNQYLIDYLTVNPFAIHNFIKHSTLYKFNLPYEENRENLYGYLLYQAFKLKNEAYIFSEVIKDKEIINNYIYSDSLKLADGSKSYTLLHYFVDKNDTQTALQLLNNGADASLISSNGSIPLLSAKKNNNDKLAAELQKLTKNQIKIEAKDNMTPDYIDFKNNKPEWSGALNEEQKQKMQEFVIIAMLANDTIQLKRLFNKGAEPRFIPVQNKNYFYQTGAHIGRVIYFDKNDNLLCAALKGYCWISFKYLVEHKIAEISKGNYLLCKQDFSLLERDNATYSVYEYLLKNGLLDFNRDLIQGNNALFSMYYSKDKNPNAYSIVELFLKYGANPYSKEGYYKDSFAKATRKDAKVQEMIMKYCKK